MKRQVALLLILSSVLEYDYFVYSDTESSDSSVNLSGGDKLFRNPTNFVCSNLNDSIASQDNLTKCFNTSLINEDAIATTELYSDDLIKDFNEEDDDEELDDDEDPIVSSDTNYNASIDFSLNDQSIETSNLTRIKPTTKLLPVEGTYRQNGHHILEFDWDLDPAEDKKKWHHKKKKKKKHDHHKKKKHWKSKKKCDHHHWHKHKHKEKHHHKHKEKHKHVHWHKHKGKHWHKEDHKHWEKHKHKKESWHKHDHKGKHKHDHGHKNSHKHKHDSKHKHHKKKKKKKGW